MQILILGSSGVLGNKIYQIFKNRAAVYHNGLVSRKKNLNYKNLEILIVKLSPDFIINCAAITNIDYCQKKKENCKKTNYGIVKNIFKIQKKNNLFFKLIHFSTDHMYDKNTEGSSSERAIPIVNNYYTKIKLISERICLKNNALVLRINFFGHSKKGITFSDWVLKKFRSKKQFTLVNDVFFNPLSLNTISKIIFKIITKNLYKPGLFNLGSKDRISKKDFGIKFAKLSGVYKNNFEIKKINDILSTKRSANMFMNVKKFEENFLIKLPKLNSEMQKEIKIK